MIRISNIKVDLRKKDLENKIRDIVKNYKSYKIIKESVDARHKSVHLIYTVDVEVENEDKYLKLNNIIKTPVEDYKYKISGTTKLKERPIIIGAGPSSLFAAYFLAKEGYKPIIYERGKDAIERKEDVEAFFKTGVLNYESNVQFGLGGAGLFSDGKLATGINDKSYRIKEVLNLFNKFGAEDNILYSNRPHIGTDVLMNVVTNMKKEIERLGGEFNFESTLTGIEVKDGKIEGAYINHKLIKTNVLIIGIGNSARDTFKMLNESGAEMASKPFAVGFRVVHSEEFISKSMYGDYYKYLEPASYKLTYNSKNHGVYTFCMCPGGYVINASSFKGKLTINGMSEVRRDSGYSNSAVVVTVSKKDYGDKLFDGVKFQEEIEKKAYNLAKGRIPVQKFNDFKENKISDFNVPKNAFKGDTKICNLNSILPSNLNKEIVDAVLSFDKKINKFSSGIMAGVEARTSSPIRILRDENGKSNIEGLYPIGEGAGYAGGITSSAVDGIKCFENVINEYKPFNLD